MFNWCLTCNQFEVFLYSACTKRVELSSLDQSFRGAIAPIALVVLLPLHERNTLCNSYVTRLYVRIIGRSVKMLLKYA